jgi:hypothetical protein
MGGGADDFVIDQTPESAYSLGEEGRKLAGASSGCLRPHLAQSGGFRMESKSDERSPKGDACYLAGVTETLSACTMKRTYQCGPIVQ